MSAGYLRQPYSGSGELTPERRKRLASMLAEPLFRTARGYRRGDLKISLATAQEMIRAGLARRVASRSGKLMLVKADPSAPAPLAKTPPANPWWLDD